MTPDEEEKSRIFMNAILDNLTVIGLSVGMLETHYKQHLDEEAKRYFENIKNHCHNIVKSVSENNLSSKKN